MEFPLATRELALGGKRWQSYALRLAPLLVVVVVLAFATLAGGASQQGMQGVGQFLGGFFVGVSNVFQSAVVILLCPLLTAGLIAKEKQERTLGLLLQADFHGSDVFMAKFFSVFVQVEALVLTVLPILAFAALFGGVNVGSAAIRVLLYTVTAVFMVSLGLLCSTLARRPSEALLLTLLGATLWAVATVGLEFVSRQPGSPLEAELWLHPITAAWSLPRFGIDPRFWLVPTALTFGLAILPSAATVVLIPRQALEKARGRRRSRGPKRPSRGGFLARSPITQLVAAGSTGFGSLFTGRVSRALVAIGLCALAVFPCWLGMVALVVLITYDVTSSLSNARASGIVDDILVTPIARPVLPRAVFRAYYERALIYFPALFLCVNPAGALPLLEGDVLRELTDMYDQMLIGDYALLGLLVLLYVVFVAVYLAFLVALSTFSSTLFLTPVKQTLFATVVWGILQVMALMVSLFSGMLYGAAFLGRWSGPEVYPAALGALLWLLAASLIAWLLFTLFYRTFAHDLAISMRSSARRA